MLLNRLRLINFKRFRDQTIEFHDGITGVIGNNGAGKSTIVEGILFALYGVKGTGLDGDFIVSSAASPRDKCEVRLDFRVMGHDYSILRTYKKTASSTQHTAEIFANGKILASGVVDVDTQVRRIIGMGAHDFKNTIFAGQKDLLSLLDETPGERKNWCMKMLGIDHLKKESDAELKTQIQEHERDLSGYERILKERQPEEVLSQLTRLNNEMTGILDEIANLEAMVKDAETRHDSLTELTEKQRTRKERWVGLNEQIGEVHRHLQSLDQTYGQLKSEQDALKSLTDEYNDLSRKEENYRTLKPVFTELREKKEQYDALNHEKTRISGYIEQDTEQRDRIALHLEQLARVEERHMALEPKIQRREDLIADRALLRKKEDTFRNLNSEKSAIDARYAMLAARVRRNRDEMCDIEAGSDLSGLSALKSEISALEQEKETLIRQIASADQQAGSANERLEEIACTLHEIRDAGEDGICPTCHRTLGDHYHTLIDEFEEEARGIRALSDRLEEEKEAMSIRQNECDQALMRQKGVVERMEQAAHRHTALKTEQNELFTDVEKCLQEISDLENRIAALEFDPAALQSIEEELAGLEAVWTEYISAQERLSGKQSYTDELSTIHQRIDERKDRLACIEDSLHSCAFDPDEFARVGEEFEQAEKAHHRFGELQGTMTRLPVIEHRMGEIEAEIVGETDRAERIRDEIASLTDSADLVRQYESELAACRVEMGDLRGRIAEDTARFTAIRQREQEYQDEYSKLTQYQSVVEQLREKVVLLKETRRMIGDYITYLLNVVRSRIESEVGVILGEITSGRYENVLIDEDFTVFVNDMGENYPAYRFSGGEQDDIAIALRIALSRYLSEMHRVQESTFLIFDEIFGSQDEERRTHLLQALRTQEIYFPQIFLISHIPDIQGEFSTTLLVEMESDTQSRVEEVSA